MSFSIAIMAHEKRADWFPYLREKLGDVPFLVDRGRPGDAENLGLWGNCRRAWLAYDRGAEWHFVLQEDSILCADFRNQLTNLLENVREQDVVLSLYAGSRYRTLVEAAMRNGDPCVIGNSIYNENALGMRTKHIEAMVDFCDRRNAETDRYIQGYARSNGLKIYTPVPSLINHRPDPSLYRNLYNEVYEDSVRQAVWFIDDPRPEIS